MSRNRIVHALFLITLMGATAWAAVTPPTGFTALYNGRDLTGWRGGDTFDHRQWLAMAAAAQAKRDGEWTTDMRKHWHATGDELVNDGNGKYATTVADYGDFELLLDYRTVALADSGIYLRGCPQVQIWDYTEQAKFSLGANKGSGGLWNNSVGAAGKDPLVKADRPLGEWNHFRIVLVGSRVTVWLNEQLVVDHARLENYYDRSQPIPVRGPIELQTHGGEIRWRNIFIREIGATEANQWLASHGEHPGFSNVFNGRDLTGWAGAVTSYAVIDGAIVCRPQYGGVIHTTEEFSDFVARLEFKLPPGGNNGLALRYAGVGDAAYTGWCESQVLDDCYEQVTGEKIDPRQAHGSAYGMIAAARGYQRPTGEWNFEEVTVRGSTLKVELNGTLILEGDLALVKDSLANRLHPGKTRVSGSFGFAGHNDPVAFRAIRLLRL
ncbi:MAG: DUF1080 domain-containing protein [Opitutaceae bacterium]|nr:DUF1080 domain-containing protein [Opitutaceae bacterium]